MGKAINNFSGANYRSWKRNIRALLTSKDLWIETMASKPSDEKDAIKWEEANLKGVAYIMMHVDAAYQAPIGNAETVGQAMKAMDDRYGGNDEVTAMNLLTTIIKLKLGPSETVAELMARFEEYTTQLMEIGNPVPELYQVNFLLNALPAEYDVMRSSILTQKRPWTYNEVCQLVSQEERRQGGLVPKQAPKQANVTRRFNGKCFNCGRPGHLARDCRAPKKDNDDNNGNQQDKSNESQQDKSNDNKRVVSSYMMDGSIKHYGEWIVDSGATDHVIINRDHFMDYEEVDGIEIGTAKKGLSMTVAGVGTARVILENDIILELKHALYVPTGQNNLISTDRMVENDLSLRFGKTKNVIEKNGQLVAEMRRKDGLFFLTATRNRAANIVSTKPRNTMETWHRRLGHLNEQDVKKLADGLATGIELKSGDEPQYCEPCAVEKSIQQPFTKTDEEKSELEPFDTVHIDYAGPIARSIDGYTGYMVIKDRASRFTTIYLMRSKKDGLARISRIL